MLLGYLLLILLPIAGIAYLLWSHQRKMAARNAASESRMAELLSVAQVQPNPDRSRRTDFPEAAAVPEIKRTPAAAFDTAAPTPAVTPIVPAPHAAEDAPDAPLYAVRERMLTPPQTLLYFLLRTGLPEHVIFARASLAAILETGPGLSGFAREEQTRRLSALTVDFVVCDRNMRPLAAVELAAPEQSSAAQADRASARSRLAAAGVRYIELDPKALPRKDAMRALVLDASGATDPAAENVPG